MKKEAIGTVLASLAGAAGVAGGCLFFWNYLREPQWILDWIALVCTGIVIGTFFFFLVWGHFQGSPKAE